MQQPQSAPPPPPVSRPAVANARPDDPTLEWVTVDPDTAVAWLATNAHNRRLKKSVVRFYVQQMEAGAWAGDAPEPISFDQDGNLINGQHRLEAIVEADRPQRLLVARGVRRKTRLLLDTGTPRTGADAIAMTWPDLRGDKPPIYAAAIRGLEVWEVSPDAGPHEHIAQRIPNPALVALYPKYARRFEQLYPTAEAIHQAGVRGGTGLWLTMLYRFAALSHDQAMVFADKVASGAGLSERSPILALRDRLNRMPAGETKLRRQLVARLIVYAWNGWRQGRKMARLQLRDEFAFPIPI